MVNILTVVTTPFIKRSALLGCKYGVLTDEMLQGMPINFSNLEAQITIY